MRCKQCRAEEGTHHKMSCSEPGGGKSCTHFKVGFPREMLFECRWCDRHARVIQKEGDEFPSGWKHFGDGPPLCPECAEEWSSRPEDER